MTNPKATNPTTSPAGYASLHLGQETVMRNNARFKVVACGRRWGKTELGKSIILESAVEKHQRAWWLAPTLLMASQVWRDLKRALIGLPNLKINESERRLDLPGGGMIAVRSAFHPDRLRGDGLDLVVLDEAAWMEARVWGEIVRPMLAQSRGRAVFLSTPLGRNWFWDLYRIGLDPEVHEWQSFHFSTAENIEIDLDELRAIRRQTAQSIWQTEYLAKFSNDAGQVFRGLADALRPGHADAPLPDHRYVAGIDWGRSRDYTAITIIDATTNQVVALDRFNQIGWALQRGRLRNIVNTWNPHIIWAEANSLGAPNIEALQRDGLRIRPFQTTAQSKSPLIESLALAIETGQLALLDHPVLLGELASYAVERLPGGSYRYTAPPGSHDDTVISTALAWYAANHSGPIIDFA